jgi:FkbM family methyltransferase
MSDPLPAVELIAGFSVDTVALRDSVNVGKPVLDVGCRGFAFASAVSFHYDALVYALDPAPDIEFDSTSRIKFIRAALSSSANVGVARFAVNADLEASHLATSHTPTHAGERLLDVESISIQQLMSKFAILSWAMVKLNCEGGEYPVLNDWPGPIADQINVSFHEHTSANRFISTDQVVEHLSQWYKPVRHVRDARYGAGFNYWDSLFVLK